MKILMKITVLILILILDLKSENKKVIVPITVKGINLRVGCDIILKEDNYLITYTSNSPEEFSYYLPFLVNLDKDFKINWQTMQIYDRPVIPEKISINTDNNIELSGKWLRAIEYDFRPYKLILDNEGNIINNFYDSTVINRFSSFSNGISFIINDTFKVMNGSYVIPKGRLFIDSYNAETLEFIKQDILDSVNFNNTNIHIYTTKLYTKENFKLIDLNYNTGRYNWFSKFCTIDNNGKILDTILSFNSWQSEDLKNDIEKKVLISNFDTLKNELIIVESEIASDYNLNKTDTIIYLAKYNLKGENIKKIKLPSNFPINSFGDIKLLKNDMFFITNFYSDKSLSKNYVFEISIYNDDLQNVESQKIINDDFQIYYGMNSNHILVKENSLLVMGSYEVNENYSLYFEEIDFNVLSVEANPENNSLIFPNPSSDKISLDLGGVLVADLVVYDILGNEIMSIPNYTNKSEIDISNLSIGTYTIQVQTSTGSISQRLLVNR